MRFLASLIVTALLLTACSKNTPSQLGELKGRRYENQHFQLALDLPADWHIVSEETNEVIKDTGREVIAGDDRVMNAAVNASMKHTFLVFTTTEFEVGTPGRMNPTLLCMVERVTHAPGIKSSADYLQAMAEMFKHSQTPIEVGELGGKRTINGIEFSTLHAKLQSPFGTVEQTYLALFRSGYVFILTPTYFDEASRAKLEGILETIHRL